MVELVEKKFSNITTIMEPLEQYVCDLESDNQKLRLLLSEAHRRFKQYEMDVDDNQPQDHFNFIRQIEAAIGV